MTFPAVVSNLLLSIMCALYISDGFFLLVLTWILHAYIVASLKGVLHVTWDAFTKVAEDLGSPQYNTQHGFVPQFDDETEQQPAKPGQDDVAA